MLTACAQSLPTVLAVDGVHNPSRLRAALPTPAPPEPQAPTRVIPSMHSPYYDSYCSKSIFPLE